MNEIQRLIHEMCPDGVPMVALGEICEIRGRIGFRGYTRADQVAEGEGALSLSPGNISNGVMDYSKGTYITWKKYEESPEIITENGDIIFCKTASCGKVAIVKNLPYKATINPQLVVLKNVSCSIPYLYYVLSSNSIQECVKKLQGVGSVPNISQAALSSFQIPLPPLPIQQRIVEILDKFTSLVSSLDSGIALRQKQYEYYRNKLLSFEEDVPMVTLGDVCNKITDGSHNPPSGIDYSSFRMISSQNIFNDKLVLNDIRYLKKEDFLKENKRTEVSQGDLLLTIVGAIGRCYVVKKNDLPFTCQRSVAVLKINQLKMIPEFVHECIININAYLENQANGAAQKGLYLNQIAKIQIPLPPLPIQLSIVRTLDTFESLLTNLKKERELRQKQYEYYREKLLTFA